MEAFHQLDVLVAMAVMVVEEQEVQVMFCIDIIQLYPHLEILALLDLLELHFN
jgi:hypothetical protein